MIYDISPPISEALQVWPGDTPPSREVLGDLRDGASTTLSTLHGTVHVGAHADAPSHYGVDAASIEQRDLDYYIGRCQVIRVTVDRGAGITPDMVNVPIRAERVLFATETFPDPRSFTEDFAALSPGLIDWLYDHGVRLVGIDTPSIDLFPSTELPSHKRCLEHDMAILEGRKLGERL